jgi:hypothetical protein
MAKQKWPPCSEKLSFFNFRYFFDLFNQSWPILLYFYVLGNKMRLILLFFSSRFDKNWPICNIFNILLFLLRSSTYSYITDIRLLNIEYILLFARYSLLFSPQPSKNCDTHEGSTLWDHSCVSLLLSHATELPVCCCISFHFSNTFFTIHQQLSIIRIYDLIIPPNRFFN